MIFLFVLKKKKKRKRKSKKNQNTFTWLQACFLGDVRVTWCNSLGDSYFQSNVIDNAENFLEYYLHITYSVFCTLTSSTHYRQIFAKSSTWDCVRCLIRPSLIAYDLMCKYNIYIFLKFWLRIWRIMCLEVQIFVFNFLIGFDIYI